MDENVTECYVECGFWLKDIEYVELEMEDLFPCEYSGYVDYLLF